MAKRKQTKGKIFSFVRVSENSMVASVRIALYLKEKLGFEISDDEDIAAEPLDLLIIVNGAYGFSKHLASLATAVKAARRIVWVQNDFTIIPPKIESQGVSPFRAAFRERHEAGKPHMDFWTTCEDWQDKTPGSLYVNWNCLTFNDEITEARIKAMRKIAYKNIFYYGSFRHGSGKSSRKVYFDRYFKEPVVSTLISSPSPKFSEEYTHAKINHMGAIKEDFSEFLGKQGLGLYIEDRMSHERFHSPANRFYEMLSAGLPIIFQPECGSMLRKAGFDPTPYIVEKARHVPAMLEKRDEIQKAQWAAWAKGRDYLGDLEKRVYEAFGHQEDELT